MLGLEYAGINIPPSWSSLLSSSKPPPISSSIKTKIAKGYRHQRIAVNGLIEDEAANNSFIFK